MTKSEYEQARLAGERARQAGRKRDTCPVYGMTEDAKTLRDVWLRAWDDEDARRRQ